VPTPTDVEPAITSKDEFQAAAVACDEKDAGACRRAARAVELGEVVPKDLARAKTFRRVELTVLVRGCEKNSVEACVTLADRYLRGEGVAPSERTAAALIDHAREICERHPEDACRNVPKN
jgi:TPR repeat protein